MVEKKEKIINAAEPTALVVKKNKETITAAAAAPLEKKESVATLTGRSSSDVELALIKKNRDSNDSAVLARTSPTPTPVASSSSGSRRISEYKSLPPPINPSDTFEVKVAPGATLSSMARALQRRAIQQQLEDDEASDAEGDNNNGSALGLGDDDTIASSAVVSSDLNSMSAIYSQDEDKMFDRKTCNEGIINVRGNVLDDINSISAESELTTDISDVHNYSREGKEKKTDKNEWLQRQPSQDCNYGTTLETAYEDFGVERQLAVVNRKGKKTKVRQGIIPKVTQKLKLLKPCNPVNVDEVSTTMTQSIADSSVKSANDDDEDDELLPYDSLNWLCGGVFTDWDCGDVDEYTTYTTTTRGNLTNDISQEEEDDEEGKIDDIFDNINLGFDVFTRGNDNKDQSTEEYDCQTEYDDCLTEAISEYEPKTIDTGVDESCHGVVHEQKEAVADTEAIRMQGMIFVAPNVDKSTVQEGYFQSATPP